ncbi:MULTISPECIES: Arc family DNA-binding protein [Acinetobacter]|uniref:Arc family DNA-binding protein n=1 Tax=Acinetobacter TaxID=469 RepID=UPI0021D1E3EE|nr:MULTISPECIES: Arc family DNA-binding protein [Acinetobacter]MCU4393615.1 Arc family DNA-binding protein [Acinetobacter parvus]MDI6619886.1 Arc family DNA-binding protein [Acinetobacter junii]
MARTDQQFPLRLPPDLKEKLEDACKKSGRSKNAEAVYRLEQSFENKVSSDLVSEYMKAVDQKNETIKKQLEISNLLIRKLAEKLPDDDPSKVRMLELVNQLD